MAELKTYKGGDFLLQGDVDFLNERLLGFTNRALLQGRSKQVFDIPIKNSTGNNYIPYEIVQPIGETEDYGYVVTMPDGYADFYIVIGPSGLPPNGWGLGSLAYDPVFIRMAEPGIQNFNQINVSAQFAQNSVGPAPGTSRASLRQPGFYSLGLANYTNIDGSFTPYYKELWAVQKLTWDYCVGTYREDGGTLELPIKYPGQYLLMVDASNKASRDKKQGRVSMTVNHEGEELHTTPTHMVDGVEMCEYHNPYTPPGDPVPSKTHPWVPLPVNISVAIPVMLMPEDELSVSFSGETPTMQISASIRRIGAYDESV